MVQILTNTNGVSNKGNNYANDPSEGQMAVPDHIIGQEGNATFASYRENAWHHLGYVFTDTVTDFNEMARRANLLGMNMHKVPVTVPGVDAADNLHPQMAIVGEHPLTGRLTNFGNASPSYEVRQPEEILNWAQFGPTDGMRWETAGLMGSTVFGCIAYETDIVLDPDGVNDVTKTYLMVTGSFDGKTANRAGFTAVRVVCGNTLDMAIKGMTGGFSFKSTKNVRDRVKAWQMSTARAAADAKVFEREAQELFATPVSDALFIDKILPSLKPRPEADIKGAQTKWDTWMTLNVNNWRKSNNAGIYATAWGAVNALTETAQWDRQIRSGNMENFYRAGAGFDAAATAYRTRALEVVKAFA